MTRFHDEKEVECAAGRLFSSSTTAALRIQYRAATRVWYWLRALSLLIFSVLFPPSIMLTD